MKKDGMKRIFLFRVFILVSIFLLGGLQGNAGEQNITIQMLGVNDFHGALDTSGTVYLETEEVEGAGRLVNLAVYLDRAQKAFQDKHPQGITERIQAGDLVGASPANSALLKDEPVIRAFNNMAFTIGTLGNHEFDEGLGEFKRKIDGAKPIREQLEKEMDDTLWETVINYPREALNQEIVIANIENKTSGSHGRIGEIPYGFKPYTIKTYEKNGSSVPVAYIGIVTKEFPNLVLAKHTNDFIVLDEAETIAKYTKELRNKGIHAIVVVSHVPAISSGGEVQGDVVKIMKAVDTLDPENSVDVIYSGHNHKYTNGIIHGKNDVRVVQSASQGKAFSDLRGELNSETQDFASVPEVAVLPVKELKKAEQDPQMKALVSEANDLIKTISEAKIVDADLSDFTENGSSQKIISKESNSHNESPLGNLVTDAQLQIVNSSEFTDENGNQITADFAVTNNGGIRSDLIVNEAAELTWVAIQTVQPFGNILQVVKLTGADLISALNEQHKNGKLNYFLQISGLTYTYQGVGDDFKVISVKDNEGNEIDQGKNYNVIINDFLFGGGDGFKSFTKGTLLTALDSDTEVFIKHFKSLAQKNDKVKAPKLGRKSEEKKADLTGSSVKNKKQAPQDTSYLKMIMGSLIAILFLGTAIVFIKGRKK